MRLLVKIELSLLLPNPVINGILVDLAISIAGSLIVAGLLYST